MTDHKARHYVTEPNPDLVPIGQSPEWIKWFEEALAHFKEQASLMPRSDKPLRLIGFRPELIDETTRLIQVHDEKSRVRVELVPQVRAAGPAHTVHHYPWDFRP